MNVNRKFYAALVAAVFLLGAALYASSKPEQTGITVTGTGIVTTKPDTASITLAVVTEEHEAASAAAKNAELMAAVTKAVLNCGIKAEDMATRNYNVYRQSRYNPQTGEQEEKGYQVSNNLTVTVRNISETGKVIDAALKAGANQLSNVSFYTNDTTQAYVQARKQAVMHAQDAARVLSESAGRKTGKLIFIEEFANDSVYRNAVAFDTAMLKSSAYEESTPINPGDTEVSVTVKAVFELK